jgi:pimeloyl-ACP methyl ester carboxylesterase
LIETPESFGPDAGLVGIFARGSDSPPPEVAVLMFNAGVLPRIGPRRINVKLARRLAVAGHASFRFDLSGQGDSRAPASGRVFHEQALVDIRAAMDHLERTRGIRAFALLGICSGAVHAFAVARQDARVVGVLMLDGHSYPTRWTVPMRHWKRFRALPWSAVLRALLRRVTGQVALRPAAVLAPPLPGEYMANPPQAEFAQALQALSERAVVVLFLFSGSVLGYYSYQRQFADAFGALGLSARVRCRYVPHIDHTVVSLEAQEALGGLVMQWADEVVSACRKTRADGDICAHLEPKGPERTELA